MGRHRAQTILLRRTRQSISRDGGGVFRRMPEMKVAEAFLPFCAFVPGETLITVSLSDRQPGPRVRSQPNAADARRIKYDIVSLYLFTMSNAIRQKRFSNCARAAAIRRTIVVR